MSETTYAEEHMLTKIWKGQFCKGDEIMLIFMQIYIYYYVVLTMKTDKMVVLLKGVEIIIIFIL